MPASRWKLPFISAAMRAAVKRMRAGAATGSRPTTTPSQACRVSWPIVVPPRSGPGSGEHAHQAQRGQTGGSHKVGGRATWRCAGIRWDPAEGSVMARAACVAAFRRLMESWLRVAVVWDLREG